MISEKSLEVLIETIGDLTERLRAAEKDADEWRETAGYQAKKANELKKRLLSYENQPNGSEVEQ